MTSHPITVPSTTSVMTARRMMLHGDIRHLPVVDDDRLVGIVSHRDVAPTDRALAAALSRLQSDLVRGRYRPLSTVMSAPVATISEHAGLADAARQLRQHRIGALVVIDADGNTVGILTRSDCLIALEHTAGRTSTSAADTPRPLLMPMPAGDNRPGRAVPKPSALVVDPSATRRVSAAAVLEAEGFDVVTCPGPTAATRCPARDAPFSEPCPRLPETLDRVVMDGASLAAGLVDAYARWRPGAEEVCLNDGGDSET